VGKTALALHWAHQVAGWFGDGHLYVNLRGFDPSGAPAAPAEAIRGFLDAFGVAPERILASPEAQAGLYRSLLAERRMLIVLDNARDERQVRPLLPASPGSLVLVTSRNQRALSLHREAGDRGSEASALTRLGDTRHLADELALAREAWQQASARASELAERPHVNQQSAFHLGQGRSHLVIVFFRERCCQVFPEPVEILADNAADLLVARGPVPGVRWRPAGPGRDARQRRHAERLVLVCEQPGPGSQIVEELVEHRVQGVCLGNPTVSLPHVQNPVNDLAE
jgi:hypothetical protein